MRDLYIFILLILWMIFTLLLVISMIGLFLFVMSDYWMRIGYDLQEALVKK